jgi:hypothetical protein
MAAPKQLDIWFMTLKRLLIRIHFFFSEQLGIDPLRTLVSIRGMPQFLRDLLKFRREYRGKLVLNPCLGDRYKEGGNVSNEYFWQDLLVAKKIYLANPSRHVDVGSRIDGFVAHVASFRDIEVFDIRPVAAKIPGVIFRQADLMSDGFTTENQVASAEYCDSLSCLHAIEHFGLGRYGDPIDKQGYLRGIKNLSFLLRDGGTLYISTPIGQQRVEFNANWVFDPSTIVNAAVGEGLVLNQLIVLDQQGSRQLIDNPTPEDMKRLALEVYRLGIFCFTKVKNS